MYSLLFIFVFVFNLLNGKEIAEDAGFSAISELRQKLQEKKSTPNQAKEIELLNVSYDPTRELYEELNLAFIKWWKERTGQTVVINQSHGGSGKQSRAVSQGLRADVVTLAIAFDIDAIQKYTNAFPQNWQSRLPHRSVPFNSTVVFLVRENNPKKILDWTDLVQEGISIVTPNPKTSGGAKWIYLAAWGYAMKKFNNDQNKVKQFMSKLYKNVPTLDTGARGATTTFVQREIGDVLLTWENEAYLAIKELGSDKFDIIYPSISIEAEPPITWIDKNIDKNGTSDAAKYYLAFHYTQEGQEIAAKHYLRPIDQEVAAKYANQFPKMRMLNIETDFGGWKKAQATHFAESGTFDQIYQK
jgi:sulfate/thiosulfate-binding protein